jgi:hypothetical protein
MAAEVISHYDEDTNKTHIGVYSISDGMVHVCYLGAFTASSTQIGGSPADTMARQLLREFAGGQLGKKKP